jgi:imidazoleglycerol phosphate dehydratase HisB
VVTEQDFFFDGEIQLGRCASGAVNDSQGIERFSAGFLGADEVIAPGLLTEINGEFKFPAIADSAGFQPVGGFRY